ncbi:hypothetical protein [Peribacillus sp. SCS-155]|uniref:hypothetical protein n=1 Tax=Peribacillus sedimenti TaxID=3115297 RepID=UPI0039063210
MIIGCSKELYKVKVDFSDLEIEKLQSHEIFGLYLIGELSFRRLREIFQIDDDELRSLISKVCVDIEKVSQKDESKVEFDF